MNLLHVKYAVEVEKTCSINKAAENLFMAQPNLSRAIKELEESLGITIFKRTSKGMLVTAKGEEFLDYAKQLLVPKFHVNFQIAIKFAILMCFTRN